MWAKLDDLYFSIYSTSSMIDYNEAIMQTIIKLQLGQKMSKRYAGQFQETGKKSNGWIVVVKEVRENLSSGR